MKNRKNLGYFLVPVCSRSRVGRLVGLNALLRWDFDKSFDTWLLARTLILCNRWSSLHILYSALIVSIAIEFYGSSSSSSFSSSFPTRSCAIPLVVSKLALCEPVKTLAWNHRGK